jgi:hypothetical protein
MRFSAAKKYKTAFSLTTKKYDFISGMTIAILLLAVLDNDDWY